ncbi:unnamed protein product [Prorocentrum cordatum]|uniref:Uncharacterized protein n=1 Tax=Prorocentrum cordatum TaxID=2364126 RepID=A0ABN9VCX4_9DINO|nr:unnamed protein product [Polarella glacialis]
MASGRRLQACAATRRQFVRLRDGREGRRRCVRMFTLGRRGEVRIPSRRGLLLELEGYYGWWGHQAATPRTQTEHETLIGENLKLEVLDDHRAPGHCLAQLSR